jgi:hypothetical protein
MTANISSDLANDTTIKAVFYTPVASSGTF